MNIYKRKNYLDTIAGILIIHMILGHIFQWSRLTYCYFYKIQTIIFYFFMPWFFFKSGMLHNSERKPSEVLYNCIRKILKPCILPIILGILIYWLNLIHDGDFDIIHYIMTPLKKLFLQGEIIGNNPLWFIVALFIIKIMFALYLEIKSVYNKISCIVIIIVLIFLRNYIPSLLINNIALGFIFYSLAFYIKKIQNNKIIIVSSLFLYLFCMLNHQIVDFHTNKIIEGNYFGWILCSIAGIIIINYIFMHFYNQTNNILSIIGKQSMTLFSYHWLIIYLVNTLLQIIYNEIMFNNYKLFIIYILSCSLILSVICYFKKKS